MKALILLLFILVGIFAVQKQNLLNRPKTINHFLSPIIKAVPPPVQKSEVHSPDGTMKLIMRIAKKGGSDTYSFFVADISGKNERLLFTKTVKSQNTMLIPQNSFSPDNSYVYLQENNSSSLDILVFKTSLEQFAKGGEYLDVASLLTQSKPGYSLANATGWASPVFLEIGTLKDNLVKGPSYWFVPETQAFLPH